MEILEQINNVKERALNIGNTIGQLQQKFMNSGLYNIANSALDIGLKAVLPDFIEDQVIDIKDCIFENGLQEGINKTIDTVKDFGKSVLGIATGNFENISQIQMASKNGGIIDTFSKFLDKALDKVDSTGIIDASTKKLIKTQKNSIMNNIKKDISKNLDDQVKYVEKIDEYSEKWREAFESQDLTSMKRANTYIQKYIKEIIPLENTLKTARKIETLQGLIENTGSFDLTQEEMELAEAISY